MSLSFFTFVHSALFLHISFRVLLSPQVFVHLSLSALCLNSPKATFVLTAWQLLHHPRWLISSPLAPSFLPSQVLPASILTFFAFYICSVFVPKVPPPPPSSPSSSSAALPEDRADAARQNSQNVTMLSYSGSVAAAALLHLSIPFSITTSIHHAICVFISATQCSVLRFIVFYHFHSSLRQLSLSLRPFP